MRQRLMDLRSVVETTGLAWLVHSVRIEMESRGRIDGQGLRPDAFFIRRDGRDAREGASVDWDTMQVSVPMP